MIQRAWLMALSLCFVFSSTAMTKEDPQVTQIPAASTSRESPTATGAAELEETASPDGIDELDFTPEPKKNQADATPDPENLAYTSWDFEIHVKGIQHEPAGKNQDEFEAQLRFAALLPHASKEPQSWTGFGVMTASVINRVPGSFQAPHRPAKNFHVLADSFWDHQYNMISVIVHPKDAVTYSLTTGEVLGTTGVLKLMLADATCDGLTGTMLAFSIPENTEAPAEFHAKFDTSGKHVCWFEGQATLKVLSKRVGKFLSAADTTETGESEGEKPDKEAEAEAEVEAEAEAEQTEEREPTKAANPPTEQVASPGNE